MGISVGTVQIKGDEVPGRELTIQIPDERIPQLMMFDIELQSNRHQQLRSIGFFQGNLSWSRSENSGTQIS